jgi:hypothetical protein
MRVLRRYIKLYYTKLTPQSGTVFAFPLQIDLNIGLPHEPRVLDMPVLLWIRQTYLQRG